MRSHTLSIFLAFLATFPLGYYPSFAQSPPSTTGNWLMFFNQSRISDKWSIHSEVQYRSFELAPNTEQLLLRGGINHHLSNSVIATVGYAYVANYAFDKELISGVQASEKRMWQQFVMRSNLGRCIVEHRYRLEQRWLQSSQSGRYLNRVRYLLRVTIPLTKKTIEPNAFFLSLYDEVFLHFSSVPFDRNRCQSTIGYQLNMQANVQLGYLAQTVSTTTKHYLIASVAYNFDFRNHEPNVK